MIFHVSSWIVVRAQARSTKSHETAQANLDALKKNVSPVKD